MIPWLDIIWFVILAGVIGIAGTKLTRTANIIAEKTGIGQALIGAILLGAMTSLSGSILSVNSAFNGHPGLSISNAIGGIIVQIFFLSIADLVYRKVNLEHAAASLENILQGVLFMILVTLVLIGMAAPEVTFFHVHPISVIILVSYVLGIRMISKTKKKPMWTPIQTAETHKEKNKESSVKAPLYAKAVEFIFLALVVGGAGFVLSNVAVRIAETTALSENFIGSLFTALATSLPELVVSVSAVRQGALTLAVGNIIGGNTFDVLFVAFSDFAYLEGSILHALSQTHIFIVAASILMTSVLLLGLLFREKKGFANIGWESTVTIIIFILAYVTLFFMG